MTVFDAKADLLRYLQFARDALLWKLDGLGEYDIRRPLTPTGTNLLGLVKHAAGVEAGYLGAAFGRPFPEPLPWTGAQAAENADMWATAGESREDITGLYRRVWAHADATVAALAPDTVGRVPWWPAGADTITLHHALVRVLADAQHHAGHADILREHLDGATGWRPDNSALPSADPAWWDAYRDRLEHAAREAAEKTRD
ncbi:hypothetical protein SRB5_22820 [Streptomyces sp. RB5]|uniref:DinB family protein n=1 Tax=Streptomyces smaragdinus TaxID=2585196 RepID=A0A7K0CGJ5_9ACTN|nr:DinB family protein [Streptomyces smaragdinus]MQY12152.1 hypothetical protein [Streptomyces smaragdinus]